MKKMTALLASLLLALSLVSCNSNHRDADDDGKCDDANCGIDYEDGCDNHRDADDNEKCDICDKEYKDGCDRHVDKNDDGK